eukprot:scaffold206762_cov35-Tisochrysis_lutea.AAC.1
MGVCPYQRAPTPTSPSSDQHLRHPTSRSHCSMRAFPPLRATAYTLSSHGPNEHQMKHIKPNEEDLDSILQDNDIKNDVRTLVKSVLSVS